MSARFNRIALGRRRPIKVKPGAIALRCIKGISPCVFGDVYLGFPWQNRTDGTGTVDTFLVSVDGRAVRKGAELFEPVNPKHRRLFLHMLTEPERVSVKRWIDDLRAKCRGEAELADLVRDGILVHGSAIPLPGPRAGDMRHV